MPMRIHNMILYTNMTEDRFIYVDCVNTSYQISGGEGLLMNMPESLQVRLCGQKLVIYDMDAQKNRISIRFFCASTHHMISLIDTITCILVFTETNSSFFK